MENVTDALYMAFAILIFVLALSISIMSFSEVRATSDMIVQMTDREDYTRERASNGTGVAGEYFFFYSENANKRERIVNVETIIPTLYRAYKENYKVIFMKKINETQNRPYCIFQAREDEKDSIGNFKGKLELRKRYYIDLRRQNISKEIVAESLITDLLYNAGNLKDEITYGISSDGAPNFDKVNGAKGMEPINPNDSASISSYVTMSDPNSLYNSLKGRKITEQIGEYYDYDKSKEEIEGAVSDNNKSKKRVITYIID